MIDTCSFSSSEKKTVLDTFFMFPYFRLFYHEHYVHFFSQVVSERNTFNRMSQNTVCDGTFVEWPVHTSMLQSLIDSRTPPPITHGSVINCTLGRVPVLSSVASEIGRPWWCVFDVLPLESLGGVWPLTCRWNRAGFLTKLV